MRNVNIYDINDQKGFISINGWCSNCGYKNDWEEIHLFQTAFMTCEKCGQKYSPPISDNTLISNIEENILCLLRRYGKIAIWGMHDHIITIFKKSDKLSDSNIYPIDNSPNKQGNTLFNKTVYSPDIINKEDISIVIVAVPWYFGIIQSTIQLHYPKVQRIINITSLIGNTFSE